MTRDLAIKVLQEIGTKFAKEYGYTNVKVGEDRQKGIWGESFTEFLEEKYGSCTKEVTWYEDNEKESNVRFRFRFSSPCLSVRLPGEVFSEIQVSDYDYESRSHTGNFDISEIIIWKRAGRLLYDRLIKEWDTYSNQAI